MNVVLFLNYSDGIFDHCSWRNWSSFLPLKITMTFILTMSIIYKCISKHLNITKKKFICFCTFIQKMMDYNSWKSEVHYLKLVEYFRSKKDLESYYVQFLKSVFTYSFSTWTMLCFHDLLHQCSVTWRWSVCGTAEVLLKPLVGPMVSFSSSVFLCWVFVIFLLTVCHWFSVGFRSGETAGYSSTAITWWANHLVVLASWAGVKSCCKRKLASPWILPAVGSIKCSKMSSFRV